MARGWVRRVVAFAAVGFLIVAWLAPPRVAAGEGRGRSAAGSVASFEPAVVLEGTARERGVSYGRRFAGGVRQFLDAEIYQAFVNKPASKEALLRYAADCGRVVRDVCPMVAEEFEGIADGAGVSFDEVVLINLHEELYHRGELPKSGHCTAVAVGPPMTAGGAGGHTLVGQTWDWMTSVAGKSAVTEWRRDGSPGGGASVLAYGFPGMPTGAGLSSAGIALCWTSAALGTKGQTARVGVPSYALITHLLSQGDLDAVIREAQRDRHAGWFTFVMADGRGNLVNIEGSPDGVAVERTTGSLTRVGYGSRRMTDTPANQAAPRHARCVALDGLLQGSEGHTDAETLQEYLSRPEHGICVGEATIDLIIYDTTARRALLSRGPSYGLSWREFGFGR